MDLSFTSEEEELRQKVRKFLAEEIPKSGLKSASEGREDKTWLAKAKAWQRKLYEAGYVALAWPKEYGGQAMDPLRQAIGVIPMTALRMIKRGDLKGQQLCRGAPWVIKAEDVVAFVGARPLTANPAQKSFDFQ